MKVMVDFNEDVVIPELEKRGYILAVREEGEDIDSDVCELGVLIERKDWLNAMAMFDRTFDANGSRK